MPACPLIHNGYLREKNIIHLLQSRVFHKTYETLLIHSLRSYTQVPYEYLVGRDFFRSPNI